MAAIFDSDCRSRQGEWMDGDDVSPDDMRACLADLARANTLVLGRRPTLAWLARATRGWPRGTKFTLVDVGAGEGDMLRAIARWAKRRGFAARLTGYDLNARCAAAARAATDPALGIEYVAGDAMTAPGRPDFIISALVAHHMADDEIARFIGWMDATATRGWLINDLHRHALAFHGFRLLANVARWHRFVRHDGPLSVARGFVRADWTRLLAAARVEGAEVAWRFPFRWTVGRVRT